MEALINNFDSKFENNYVAIKSIIDRDVISFGTEPSKVLTEAHEKGYDNSIIFFVPSKGMSYFY